MLCPLVEHDRKSLKSKALRSTVSFLFKVLTRREVYGLENIPKDGPCLLIFNHLSTLDAPLLFSVLPRSDVTGLVAASYRDRPFHRLMVESAGGTWLRHGPGDRAALETALSLLGRGWIVGIAPEGMRSPTKRLVEAKPGPSWLAIRSEAPIVPVAITNVEHLGGALRRFRRVTITVRIGKPFRLPQPGPAGRKEHRRVCSNIMMCRIAALLPPQYRGVYADHPYLQSLLGDDDQDAPLLEAVEPILTRTGHSSST